MPQDAVVIGVPAYRAGAELTFWRLLAMPFRLQPPYWRLPDGRHPDRPRLGDSRRLAA